MKTKLSFAALLAVGIWIFGCAPARGQCEPPVQPAPLAVAVEIWGKPPAISGPAWPAGASDVQFEFWRIAGTEEKLFARVWVNRSDWWNDKYLYRDPENDKMFLIGAGPGKLRAFPAGDYVAQWRGWNICGYGAWSVRAAFTIDPPPVLAVDVDVAPDVVGTQDPLDFGWHNNFAASRYKLEIRLGKKVVRRATLAGGFGYFWKKNRPGLTDQMMRGGSYKDRPKSPRRELANGTDYVFRVSGYSPVAKKWSAWGAAAFEIARGAPAAPTLGFSQEDFGGYFSKSLRPYFRADYGDQPALWSYFSISRRTAAGKLSVVRRQWISRYAQESYGYIGGSGGRGQATVWPKDLPPGEYVWSVQAWNGTGVDQSAWTPAATSMVESAGVPATPDAYEISLPVHNWNNYLDWAAVPDAYSYRYEIYRNGRFYRRSPILDPGKGKLTMYRRGGEVRVVCPIRPRLPQSDNYTVRIQAVNLAKSAGEQSSAWSALSAPLSTIPGSISGWLIGPDGSTPLPGIWVGAYSWIGDGLLLGAAGLTDNNGYYQITLGPGTFRLDNWDPLRTYASEVYDNAPTFELGTDVVVPAGTAIADINFYLDYQ